MTAVWSVLFYHQSSGMECFELELPTVEPQVIDLSAVRDSDGFPRRDGTAPGQIRLGSVYPSASISNGNRGMPRQTEPHTIKVWRYRSER